MGKPVPLLTSAQQYFQYDAQCRVTLHAVQGAGGAATGGICTYTFN